MTDFHDHPAAACCLCSAPMALTLHRPKFYCRSACKSNARRAVNSLLHPDVFASHTIRRKLLAYFDGQESADVDAMGNSELLNFLWCRSVVNDLDDQARKQKVGFTVEELVRDYRDVYATEWNDMDTRVMNKLAGSDFCL